MSEANKTIFRRFVDEVINRGDLGAVDELLAPSYHQHDPLIPGLPGGREGAKQLFALLHAGFPDLSVTLEDLVAEGERVAARSRWRGTHRGEFLGIRPTDQVIDFENLELVRIRQGQILKHWGLSRISSILQHLGSAQPT
ncbi:protein of unknown function DUF1486 [Allomeiothermus silvanus DSM 9946]|uniref:Ester cyclase n=1 Tax=Allomeiothermus silvanus (strain ATCC 700542 / DSM 9946 / NBRC 106475 / NCIMB 13440 / VI-R2) TaxID=526227 RepID=D7BB21_ALLS1|nr:ester cyclase [Allomeiothermus silvanus]ADH64395.1 protein of unknown function DUF1486 [Allomeiothermus silvanus DSM 9946]